MRQQQQVVSPEVNADNSVTFRYMAPEASKVTVNGNFARGQELSKGENGIWSVTVGPLEPQLYTYSFSVDGITALDPNNVYTSRDVATVTNFFIVKGAKGSLGDLLSTGDVPHGTVSRLWYPSAFKNEERRVTVYLPPGYESGSQSYPVLYVLHGIGGDEEAWITQGRVAEQMDNLIATGRAVPMIVVMTNGNISQDAAPGYSKEGLVKPGMGLPNTMDGTFEQYFPEIMSYVEKTFRVKEGKANTAICGLSMGGFHTRAISANYPDRFDYVGLFSSALGTGSEDRAQSPTYQDMNAKIDRQFSNPPKVYWIAIGNEDFLFNANTEYREHLDSKGYKYEYLETGGGHTWANWRHYFSLFAPMCFK